MHVSGVCFCTGHMEVGGVLEPAGSSAGQCGSLKHLSVLADFRPKGFGRGLGQPKHRPALRPADTAVGDITFGRADTAVRV